MRTGSDLSDRRFRASLKPNPGLRPPHRCNLATIWCAISGHGFGHAAQVVPILNELGRHLPGLTAILRSTVPASFFHDRLTIPWSLQSVQQDVGCVQHGPLDIDVPATWEAHRRFHASWESRMATETAALAAAAPAMVLADTPYLALSAGKHTRHSRHRCGQFHLERRPALF